MTGLIRTDLPTSQKVELAAMAFARQAEYGAKTELARRYDVSRPTVYAAGATAEEVLEQHFTDHETGRGRVSVTVDQPQLEGALVALRCMAPNSIRAIEDLIPILYPGVRVSYGKIQQILVEAEGKAAALNTKADMSLSRAAALDEMYSQGDPVLAGVGLDSGYLFALALRDSRGGEDWAEVLRTAKGQGLDLEVVVKDAALSTSRPLPFESGRGPSEVHRCVKSRAR